MFSNLKSYKDNLRKNRILLVNVLLLIFSGITILYAVYKIMQVTENRANIAGNITVNWKYHVFMLYAVCLSVNKCIDMLSAPSIPPWQPSFCRFYFAGSISSIMVFKAIARIDLDTIFPAAPSDC